MAPGSAGTTECHSLYCEAYGVDEASQGHQVFTPLHVPLPHPQLLPSLLCAAVGARPWDPWSPALPPAPPGSAAALGKRLEGWPSLVHPGCWAPSSDIGAVLQPDPFLSLTRWPQKPGWSPGGPRDGRGCCAHHSLSQTPRDCSAAAAGLAGETQGPR